MSNQPSILTRMKRQAKSLAHGIFILYATGGIILAVVGLLASDPSEGVPWMGLAVVAGPGLTYYTIRLLKSLRTPNKPTEPTPTD